MELRFHTEGTIEAIGDRRWRATDGDASVDIISGTAALGGRITSPDGWIRPLRLLSLVSQAPALTHLVTTVLVPKLPGRAAPETATATVAGGGLDVQVGADRIRFARTQEGWTVQSVSLGSAGGGRQGR
jgi:hypothetical protein